MQLTYHYDNLRKHGISTDEVDECLCDPNRVHLRKGNSILIVGKTYAGRIIETGINENGFVYHAMDASKFCYNIYKRQNKR
jgi:hypothetical protein